MRTGMLYVSALLLCLVSSGFSSCERKPGRPNAELCTWQSEGQFWECEDAFNNTRPENNSGHLMCTTLDGYLILEKYIDEKELRVRDLERELSRCRKK